MSAKLIVFEGIDGAGKSTLSKAVVNHLNKKSCTSIRLAPPGFHSPIGKAVANELKSTTGGYALQSLFAASRLKLIPGIRTYINQGVTVIFDRYSFSSLVYGSAMGLSEDWCLNLEAPMPPPDHIFYIDITPEVSSSRSGNKDWIEKNHSLLQNCREKYLRIAAKSANWTVLNGEDKIENLIHIILNKIMQQE